MSFKRLLTFLFLICIVLTVQTCKKEPPVVAEPLPPSGPDTTSHNFIWAQYKFGTSTSFFGDCTIINDSDIWCVGSINEATESTYNAVHWDGRGWTMLQIPFYTICGQSHTTPYPIYGVFAFNEYDVWFTNGGEMMHWTGGGYEHDCSINSLISGGINKIWGTSPSNMFVVGNNGTILHYNGNSWIKQESGTTIDLHDVWGSSDGKTIWACGYTSNNFHSILLKYQNNQWQTLWQRDGSTAIFPFGFNVGSVWRSTSTYVTSSNGVFRLDTDTTQTKLSGTFSGFTPSLRGNADNDIVVCGDDAVIWHYNGQTGKQLNGGIQLQPLNACALKGNLMVAVGSDYSTFPNQALIYIGQRK